MTANVIFVICAYLFGALPHLHLLARMARLKIEGDLHIGLWRQGGRLAGTIGVLGDIAKGVIVILVGRLLNLDISVLAFGGLAVVIGQMWPVFSRFEGEKGNSTGLGMVIILTPLPALIALIPIITGLMVKLVPHLAAPGQSLNEKLKLGGPPSLSLPLGMAIGFLVLPFASYWLGEPPVIFWCYFALFVLIMARRAVEELGADLKLGRNRARRLARRILYDRSEI